MYPDTDFETAKAWHNLVLPGRETHFLMLGRPAPGTDVYGHNTFMHREMQSDPLSRKNRLTMPSDTPGRDRARRQGAGLRRSEGVPLLLRHRRHQGLPHPRVPAARAVGGRQRPGTVGDDAPVPRRGGDEQNLRDLEEYTTKRYPGIRWISLTARGRRLLADGARNRPSQGDAEHLVRHVCRDRRSPVHHVVQRGGPPAHLLTEPTALSPYRSTARTRRSAGHTSNSKPTRCRICTLNTRTTGPSSACTSNSSR